MAGNLNQSSRQKHRRNTYLVMFHHKTMGVVQDGSDKLIEMTDFGENVVPLTIYHPAMESLGKFARESLEMITMMADNPTWTLERGIDELKAKHEREGTLSEFMPRLIPVWDNVLGWRFFWEYVDGTRIETGRVWNQEPRPAERAAEMETGSDDIQNE